MDKQTKIEAEAAAFRRLVAHLQERTDVQNIDMMNLTGFCRNCLGRWYQEAANERGVEMSKEEGRAHVHGMPTSEWKEKYQREENTDKQEAFVAAYTRTHGEAPK